MLAKCTKTCNKCTSECVRCPHSLTLSVNLPHNIIMHKPATHTRHYQIMQRHSLLQQPHQLTYMSPWTATLLQPPIPRQPAWPGTPDKGCHHPNADTLSQPLGCPWILSEASHEGSGPPQIPSVSSFAEHSGNYRAKHTCASSPWSPLQQLTNLHVLLTMTYLSTTHVYVPFLILRRLMVHSYMSREWEN